MTTTVTDRFGFIAVYNAVPSTSDWACTYWNWIAADSILYAAAVSHKHDGATALASPTGTLATSTATTGGYLSSGTTYYFAVTYVDAYGKETAASDVVSQATGAGISTPETPTINDDATPTDIQSHSGGLTGGDYWYKIAYLQDGGETLPSAPVYVQIPTDDTYECTIHFTSLNDLANGADTIRVYRKIGYAGSYVKLSDITAGSRNYYTDDNTGVPTCDVGPKSASTISSFNTITIDWSSLDYVNATDIKIYATTTDGTYPANSLVATVALDVATPPSSYIWTGTARTSGKPPEITQCFASPSKINLTNAAEIQGNLPWSNLPSDFSWGAPVANKTALDEISGIAGEARVVLDEDAIYVWDADLATPAWALVTGGSDSDFIGVFDYAEDLPEDAEDKQLAYVRWENISKAGWYYYEGNPAFTWWNCMPNYYMDTIDDISTDMSADANDNELKGKINAILIALRDANIIWT